MLQAVTTQKVREESKGLKFDEKALDNIAANSCRYVECDFRGANLGTFTAIKCVFELCDFSGVKFSPIAMRYCMFAGCNFSGAVISSDYQVAGIASYPVPSIISRCDFEGSEFRGCSFLLATISSVQTPLKMIGCDISGATNGFKYGELPLHIDSNFLVANNQTSRVPIYLYDPILDQPFITKFFHGIAKIHNETSRVQNFDNTEVVKYWRAKKKEEVPTSYLQKLESLTTKVKPDGGAVNLRSVN